MKQIICQTTQPVLIQEGFDIGSVTVPALLTSQTNFRLATDRGYLKYLDVIPLGYSNAQIQDNLKFTLNLGGQNLLQNENLPQWGVNYQNGRDHKWQVRAKFSDGQTGFINLNGNDESGIINESQRAQVIAKYSTDAHEAFLSTFRLKFGQGLKRREYVHQVPNVAVINNISSTQYVTPRNNGQIIGLAVSVITLLNDGAVYPNDEQNNTLVSVSIDGVDLIRNVSSCYYNMANGRDYYLNPVCINAGSTLEIKTETLLANTTPFFVYVNLYFDN